MYTLKDFMDGVIPPQSVIDKAYEWTRDNDLDQLQEMIVHDYLLATDARRPETVE